MTGELALDLGAVGAAIAVLVVLVAAVRRPPVLDVRIAPPSPAARLVLQVPDGRHRHDFWPCAEGRQGPIVST